MLQLMLRANDGEEIAVDKDVLCHSHLFKNMLIDLGLGVDDEHPPFEPLTLTAVDGWTLQKIIEWCSTHKDFPNRETEDDADPRVELTEEDKDFLDVTDEQLLAILRGANYLHIPDLVDTITQKIANLTKTLSYEDIQQFFDLDEGDDEKGSQPRDPQWYDM